MSGALFSAVAYASRHVRHAATSSVVRSVTPGTVSHSSGNAASSLWPHITTDCTLNTKASCIAGSSCLMIHEPARSGKNSGFVSPLGQQLALIGMSKKSQGHPVHGSVSHGGSTPVFLMNECSMSLQIIILSLCHLGISLSQSSVSQYLVQSFRVLPENSSQPLDGAGVPASAVSWLIAR